ncbi:MULTISPECIES: 6-carboxyhexanoate--CoA ligase [Pelosinus]|nr:MULTISPECIES: 6-carboxyhexanoate--CoA ligase [Pelosinus]
MLYSVRMRSAQGGAHEMGGRHISGAERLVVLQRLGKITQDMLERAFSHTRGSADFVNITIEAVPREIVKPVRLLPARTVDVLDFTAGRAAAKSELLSIGVSNQAVERGMEQLVKLTDSMRGAMLVCAKTGERLDNTGMRGIRVSRMDSNDEDVLNQWMECQGLQGIHAREGMILATKVVSAPGVIAELCWSDDPEYVTGYVASAKGYIRFTKLKPYGSSLGGRVFFIRENSNVAELCKYLEKQPVLVTVPTEGEDL